VVLVVAAAHRVVRDEHRRRRSSQEVNSASVAPLTTARPPGTWLSAPLSADVARSDLTGLRAADELDHRADRIREAAGVRVLGLVLMLLTARPELARATRVRPAAAANTRSNGSV